MKKYYVVCVGRNPGIYKSRFNAEEQIRGYSGSKMKGFNDLKKAEEYYSKFLSDLNKSKKKSETDQLKEIMTNKTSNQNTINIEYNNEITDINTIETIDVPDLYDIDILLEYESRSINKINDELNNLNIMKDVLEVFADGSYSDITDKYGCGIRILFDDKKLNIANSPLKFKNLRKNKSLASECLSIITAMDILIQRYIVKLITNKIKKIIIYNDCESVIKSIDKDNRLNMLNSFKEEYLKRCKVFKRIGIKVKLEYVKGHNGNKDNTIADILAKHGCLIKEGTFKYIV